MKKISKSLLSVFLCLLFVMLCVVPAAGAGDDWGSFRGSADNNAVVDFSLPLPAEAMLAYRFALKDADDWATNISEPLLSGGSLVIAVGDELLILDRQGKAAYRYALASAIGYNCRLALAGELVIVPLADASVQAIRFADGETVWQTEPVVTMDENGAAQYHSIQSAIAFDGESLYIPTVCFDVATYAPVRGELLCVNAQNGEVRWQYDNTDGGYNWNGAAVRDGKVILAGQDGNVSVFDEKTGSLLSSLSLSAPVSAVVTYAEGAYYTVASDGVFYQFTVDGDGRIAQTGSVAFAYSSTSSPAISGGKAYVGGLWEASLDWSNPAKGVFAVIDLASMTLEKKLEAPAEVKASPLVSTENGTRAYFTCNNYPGALYCYDGKAVDEVYVPTGSDQNYCIASPIASDDGAVYYWNDSGALFAVKKSEPAAPGDIDADGEITTSDARLLLRMAVHLDKMPQQILSLGDINKDGAITTADARLLLRQAIGLDGGGVL